MTPLRDQSTGSFAVERREGRDGRGQVSYGEGEERLAAEERKKAIGMLAKKTLRGRGEERKGSWRGRGKKVR